VYSDEIYLFENDYVLDSVTILYPAGIRSCPWSQHQKKIVWHVCIVILTFARLASHGSSLRRACRVIPLQNLLMKLVAQKMW